MIKPDGGTAFPSQQWVKEEGLPGSLVLMGGMTIRDYFAAAALQGMYGWFGSTPIVHEVAAKIAYETADAMLQERTK